MINEIVIEGKNLTFKRHTFKDMNKTEVRLHRAINPKVTYWQATEESESYVSLKMEAKRGNHTEEVGITMSPSEFQKLAEQVNEKLGEL